MGTRAYSEIQSVARATSVLAAFNRRDEWATSALARELGLHKSVVHRLLLTLMSGGLLVRDSRSDLFSLSPLVASLGRRAQRSGTLMQVARPILHRLAEESGETASLAMLHGEHWIYLDGVESAQAMRLTLSPGETFPLHAGCVGKVLLAFQPGDFVEALLAKPLDPCTPNTITDPVRLRREIEEIRAHGVGFSDSETTPGVRSVAAPVFDPDGRMTICLVISGPTFRIVDAALPALFLQVRHGAAELSRTLGYRARPPVETRETENAVQS